MFVAGSIIALASVVVPASSLPFGTTTNFSSTTAAPTSVGYLWQSPVNWQYYGSCIDERNCPNGSCTTSTAKSDWYDAFGKHGFTMGKAWASPTTKNDNGEASQGDLTSYSMSLENTTDKKKWCMVSEIQDCYFDFRLVHEIRVEFDVHDCDSEKGEGAWVSPIWMTRGWKGCYGTDPCSTSGEIDFLESGNGLKKKNNSNTGGHHHHFWTNFAGGENEHDWTADKAMKKIPAKITTGEATGEIRLTKDGQTGDVQFKYCKKTASGEKCTKPLEGASWYKGKIGTQSGCDGNPDGKFPGDKRDPCIFKFVGSIWNSTLGNKVVPFTGDSSVSPKCTVGVKSLRIVPYETELHNLHKIFQDYNRNPVTDITNSKCYALLDLPKTNGGN